MWSIFRNTSLSSLQGASLAASFASSCEKYPRKSLSTFYLRLVLKAVKSKYVDAPVIVGSPVVIECELIEFVETENFTTVLAKVVNMAADESVLGENGKIDTGKIGMIFYESFSNSYYKLGEKVGKAWSEGKVFME